MAYFPGTDKGEILIGTREDDAIEGKGGDDTLYGDAGADSLTGGEGADYLDGGPGLDYVEYGDSPVGVAVDLSSEKGYFGTAEGDTIVNIERVIGSRHADLLIGSGEADTLYGVGGNDTLKGMGGADYLIGGDGIDTASYDESPEGVYVNLTWNTGALGDAEGDSLQEIENLSGSHHDDALAGDGGENILWGMSGSDALFGGGLPDTLHGGWGDDQLTGDGGDDMLLGENGNDVISGGVGADTMMGGLGDDTYYVLADDGDVVIESVGQGIDGVRTAGCTLTAGSIETLVAFDEDLTTPIDLTGNSSDNVLIRGNAGDNVINGGGGVDGLIGLGGADSFLFDTALDAATNVDNMFDFSVTDDSIWLDDAIFTVLPPGELTNGRFVIAGAAQDAADNIIYNSATGAVLYDIDGTGPADAIQFALLATGLPLTHHDFVVV